MSATVTLALLFFLSVTLNEQVTEGCTCLPRHPQQHFCASDIGRVQDGNLVLNLCDLVKPWKELSQTQKMYLRMYHDGCVCEISPCTGASCLTEMVQKKCLIRAKDLFTFDDDEALQSICLPESAGADVCKWRIILN